MIFVAAASVFALGAQPAATQEPAPAAPPKQDLTNWWLQSSLAYSPMPAKALYHMEATASYANNQGNTDGTMLNIKGEFDARKHRWTNRFNVVHGRQSTNYGQSGGLVRVTQNTISNRVDFDLTKSFVLVAGIENYRDTVILIERRLSVFGGFGTFVKPHEKHTVNFTAGLAHSQFRFDETVLGPAIVNSGAAIDTMRPSSGAFLCLQNWHWAINKKMAFNQQGLFIDYFNSGMGRRWQVNGDLSVPLSKHVALSVSYSMKSEINQYTRIMGVRPQDRAFMTGIRVSL